MHVKFGQYHVRDVKFVAAFDVDAKKVGFDLSEAIFASENNTIKIADVPRPTSPCSAARHSTASVSTTPRPSRSPTHRGRRRGQGAQGRERRRDGVVPAGGFGAGRQVLRAVRDRRGAWPSSTRWPVFIASDPVWAKKFTDAGVPIVGDDIKSRSVRQSPIG